MAARGAKGCRARPRLSVALEWTFVPLAGAARPSYTGPLKLELSFRLERQRLDVAGARRPGEHRRPDGVRPLVVRGVLGQGTSAHETSD